MRCDHRTVQAVVTHAAGVVVMLTGTQAPIQLPCPAVSTAMAVRDMQCSFKQQALAAVVKPAMYGIDLDQVQSSVGDGCNRKALLTKRSRQEAVTMSELLLPLSQMHVVFL